MMLITLFRYTSVIDLRFTILSNMQWSGLKCSGRNPREAIAPARSVCGHVSGDHQQGRRAGIRVELGI